MRRKALRLIDFGYTPTFRQLMQSYRFWMTYIKKGKIKMSKGLR